MIHFERISPLVEQTMAETEAFRREAEGTQLRHREGGPHPTSAARSGAERCGAAEVAAGFHLPHEEATRWQD